MPFGYVVLGFIIFFITVYVLMKDGKGDKNDNKSNHHDSKC